MGFADPLANVRQLDLSPGSTVADFGAGAGAYTLALAEVVGRSGRVFAVEIQKELLARLEREVENRKIGNVDFIWGDLETVGGSKLPDASADFILLSNILFQLSGLYPVSLEAKRVLKPGGRVGVIEWAPSAGGSFAGLGPKPEQIVDSATVKQVFGEAEFRLVKEFPAGDYHYGLIFQKA